MTGKMLKINPLITQLLLIRRKSREFQPKFRHGIKPVLTSVFLLLYIFMLLSYILSHILCNVPLFSYLVLVILVVLSVI